MPHSMNAHMLELIANDPMVMTADLELQWECPVTNRRKVTVYSMDFNRAIQLNNDSHKIHEIRLVNDEALRQGKPYEDRCFGVARFRGCQPSGSRDRHTDYDLEGHSDPWPG